MKKYIKTTVSFLKSLLAFTIILCVNVFAAIYETFTQTNFFEDNKKEN